MATQAAGESTRPLPSMVTESAGASARPPPSKMTGEPELDLPKLLLIATAPYTMLTAAMHPLNVMKTRAQANSSIPASRLEQFRIMIGRSGIRGLFAGLGPVLAGAVPARASYIAALEAVRPHGESAALSCGAESSVAAAFGHGIAGLAAATVSMLIYVPVDVISQKMMVDGSPALRDVVRTVTSGPDGWRGLFRGLGISMAIGLPAGSIWWATYGAVRESVTQRVGSGDMRLPELAQKALASTAAAAATVAVVAPLDTIKTQHQLRTGSGEGAGRLAVRLISRDGLVSLYAGSTPRLLHLALWSSMLITIYEEMKSYCLVRRSTCSDRS